MLGSSRKLRGAAEHLIDGSKKGICQLSFEFFILRFRMLLKGAVMAIDSRQDLFSWFDVYRQWNNVNREQRALM